MLIAYSLAGWSVHLPDIQARLRIVMLEIYTSSVDSPESTFFFDIDYSIKGLQIKPWHAASWHLRHVLLEMRSFV